MVRNLILLLGLSCTCCFSSTEKGDVQQLLIDFDGYKDEFYEKYDLRLSVTDTTTISRIIADFKASELLFMCPNRKPVLWEIDAYIVYEDQSKDYLFSIGSSTQGIITLYKELYRCRANEALVKEIMEMVRVERIRSHDGPLDQRGYDKILTEN